MHPEARPTRPIPPSGADERVLASGVERGRIRRLPEFIITPGREVASRGFAFWMSVSNPLRMKAPRRALAAALCGV